jgi:carboxylesterase
MLTNDQTIKIKGGKIGVLLVHGLAGNPAEVRFAAGGLARLGYTVSCPTLAGHGGSTADLEASTWQDWYKSCSDALDELRLTCDTVYVGGLSTGAILGLMLAARRPDDVQGTLLYSPTLWLSGWGIPWYSRLFPLVRFRKFASLFSFSDRAPHGIKDARIRDFIMKAMNAGDTAHAGLLKTPGIAVLEHRRLVDAIKPLLGKIMQPTLILHPREDDLAGIDNSFYLQKKLGGSIEMVVLEDSYHMITIDRQRHVVVERTGQFIAAMGAAAVAAAEKAALQARARAGAMGKMAVAA